jgi:hypothetical protein
MTLIPTLEDISGGVNSSINPTTAGGIVAFPYVVFSENTGVRGVLENVYFLRNFFGGTDFWSDGSGNFAPTLGTTTYSVAGNTYRAHAPGRGISATDVTCFGPAPNSVNTDLSSTTQILVRE